MCSPSWLSKCLLCLFLITGQASAQEYPVYRVKYLSNYDGDTVTLLFFIWPKITIQKSARLNGIDTPEIRGKCDEERTLAKVAKDKLHDVVIVAETVSAVVHGIDKYGRPLITLWADNENVGQMLMDWGLARGYFGGRREPWCPPN